MLRILGNPRRLCDGFTRRELLQAGSISLFGGMTLPNLLRAEDRQQGRATSTPMRRRQAEHAGWLRPGKAKSVILLYLMGGPPHQDMYDLKPHAPQEIRGEFKPIATSAPGVEICELLARSAPWMHRSAIVRSVSHQGGDHNPLPSFTGYNGPSASGNILQPGSADPPSMGSVCEYLGLAEGELPAYVHMPCYLGWGQAIRRPGPYAGFLGTQYEALYTQCDPHTSEPARPAYPQVVRGTPRLPGLVPEITADRLSRRRSLRDQIDRGLADVQRSHRLAACDEHYQKAFDLLTSPKARAAFDADHENPKVRQRYGNSLFGETTLVARRLVEAGARFVTAAWDLYWERVKVDYDGWDTHRDNFKLLKTFHLPYFDLAYSALLEELETRGLLDETLVVVMGEMGRTPRINGNAGRDHWTHCYSVLFSGAGIRGGSIYGASDKHAAYPAKDPVSPGDICATIYHCLGIDPAMPIVDPLGRPVPVAHGGRPIAPILV